MHARQDDVEDDHVEVATPLQGGHRAHLLRVRVRGRAGGRTRARARVRGKGRGHRAHRAVDDLGAEGDLVRVRVRARVRIRVRARVRIRVTVRVRSWCGT